jgi:small subunit ribosomal protein S1
MSEDMQKMLNTMELSAGDIVEGTVTEVEDKRVLVDIGHKFTGVIPIRELSPLRIEHPGDIVSVGQKVVARVVKLDDDAEVVVLSRKDAAAERAWDELKKKFEENEAFEVTVHDVVKGGLVTDVGVRGFIPASLVDRQFVEDLSDYKGKTIRVRVAEIDPENNKLILSRKAVLDDEYQQEVREKISRLTTGTVIEGTVQRLTDFGAFVDVGGVDGLVHISELAWHHVNKPDEVVKPGDKVRVYILGADPDAGRVSLSIRHATPSPWETYANEFRPGDVVTGKVVRLVDFGAFVELRPGLEGLVHVSQISHQHVERPSDVLEEGQEVKVRVLSVEPERKRISLSIKGATESPRRREPQKYSAAHEEVSGTGATLGDLFRDLFKNDN